MEKANRELSTVVRYFDPQRVDFPLDQVTVDISILVLNGIITGIWAQAYLDGQVVREHAWQIMDEVDESWGPDSEDPPMTDVPADTRLRLVVTPNPAIPANIREDWFRRLGWTAAEKFAYPPEATREVYGAFVSGGFGLQRSFLSVPSENRLSSPGSASIYGKGR